MKSLKIENSNSNSNSNKDIPTNPLALKIKTKFLQWSQSVTYHCFPKIFKETKKTNLCAKLICAFVFVSFSGLTSYLLLKNIIAYYRFNVVSSIKDLN